MKKLLLLVTLFILSITTISFAFDSAYTGAQVEAELDRCVGRNTTVGDPGSDAELVTEQAIREAFDAHTSADTLVADVKEANVSAVKKGQPCAIVGSSGAKFEVQLADCDDAALVRLLGIAETDTTQNNDGTVVHKGLLTNVDTQTTNSDLNPGAETWAAGEMLYVSQTPGGLTKTRPTSGRCIKACRSLKGNSASDTLLAIVHTNPVCACSASGEDVCSRMGDSAGVNKHSFKDYANVEVAKIDSDGNADFTSILGGDYTILNSGYFRCSTTTTAHSFSIPIYDVDDTTWRDAFIFTNGDVPTVSLGAGVTFDGLGALTMGGVILGDSSPDTAGELGYDGDLKYYDTALRILASLDKTQTFTNKTIDANATGNVIKGYGYITLKNPNQIGAGMTTVTTTDTVINYGMPTFVDSTDEATNWMQWFIEVPRDIDTSIDLVAWFKFRLGGADTADHDYVISMVDIADSAAQAGTPANAVNLAYSADASGADGDIETAGGNTLTDWKSGAVAGTCWMIRIARDGDDGTNDASTVDSYPVELTIRYGFTQ